MFYLGFEPRGGQGPVSAASGGKKDSQDGEPGGAGFLSQNPGGGGQMKHCPRLPQKTVGRKKLDTIRYIRYVMKSKSLLKKHTLKNFACGGLVSDRSITRSMICFRYVM